MLVKYEPKKARKFKSWSDEAHEMWCNFGVAAKNDEAVRTAISGACRNLINRNRYERAVEAADGARHDLTDREK